MPQLLAGFVTELRSYLDQAPAVCKTGLRAVVLDRGQLKAEGAAEVAQYSLIGVSG